MADFSGRLVLADPPPPCSTDMSAKADLFRFTYLEGTLPEDLRT
jgi:hypothetical protein